MTKERVGLTEKQELFEVAECRPVSEQHLLQHRWLKRGNSVLFGLRTLRSRADWKDILVTQSTGAKQHLRVLISPQVGLRPMKRLSTAWRIVESLCLRGKPEECFLLLCQGPGTCDHTRTERAINIVTSLPFFALGLQTFRCTLLSYHSRACRHASTIAAT